MISEALAFLTATPNRRLGRSTLRGVAAGILRGEASAPQIAGLLVALRMQGETSREIEAFVGVMREQAVAFPRRAGAPAATDGPLLDTCGTGGDGLHTINVSTAAALLVAAAGVPVAKHGNRSASSKCGSADVLEAMGYNLAATPEQSDRVLAQHRFCFLFAPHYHPAMRHAAEARKALGVRTLFNLCGPLANPARPNCQMVGVASPDLMEPMAEALIALGCRRALVVHGADGMDELTTTAPTRALLVDHHGTFSESTIDATELGLPRAAAGQLAGGDAATNAALVRDVLVGKPGPHADVVNLNAAAGLWVAGMEPDLGSALDHILAVQRSGKAARLLDDVIAASKGT